MNIMAVDTSHKLLHVALKTAESYESITRTDGGRHAETLIPQLIALVERAGIGFADLDLLVCTKGPGSFTGLRIAMSALKGISLGVGVPLVSVPTMDMLREPVKFFPGAVMPVIDAKKKRWYVALYTPEGKMTETMDLAPEDMPSLLADYDNVLLTGPDALTLFPLLHAEIAKTDLTMSLIIDNLYQRDMGESLMALGQEIFLEHGSDDIGAGPVYIRKSDAEEALARKTGLS
ncbi:tRNA (adenosine(37)-N6)-threonylcarbamoyltransferase complex dimerization subunit type 1 TsaB [Parasphaerochaeta coccoides]|uniref:Universal protein YeaZ n=1 Tax=Parasphaerochaeta coccoides (strain ATCC BAA-1237 / DSM 17374 / SPN1) TaxID=760011 RepID=F4GIM3_PARC1|nr:tRNA (adenosine(37)-N6)-threonylcarbamoyltransferase complex dimerization subunit type 1 TsaB [Parasphaerochaeta coccoides]AEC02157.1 universal protein YeaZ [Parasphaerochaeta coccoides DSM 17374]